MAVSSPSATWPAGLAGAGVAAGIKRSGEVDLGLLVADQPTTWAGVFTRNAAAAPCVVWNRGLLGRPARAVVANSGNANACTGAAGSRAVEVTAASTAALVGCEPQDVLVVSTGVIGVPLAVDHLVAALPRARDCLTTEVGPFAASILTTDTTVKIASAEVRGARATGVAKGAAMVTPNMGTMLAFLATDAQVDHPTLQELLGRAVDTSFNRISVDACESTNDTVLSLATGGIPVRAQALGTALEAVCASLAEQIARDAEGGTRLVRIDVEGADDDDVAATLGRAVAASALWRSAVHGADPNWGRVVAALGAADRSLELARLSIAIGDEVVFATGEPSGNSDAAAHALSADEVTVTCSVGEGSGKARILSADLSPSYVTLNAFATT
jgi:glutamate N-acetyltransferase/amino-acid N-acetyltransferase